MIVAECSVFLTMLAGGMVAAFVATFFLALGGASKAARCVFDLLTPICVGGIFLLFLYLSSSGVFRVYALVAFVLGGALFRWLYHLIRPYLKKILCRLTVPIKSLEDRVERRLLPLREKRERKRAERRLLREEKRRHHAEEKAKRRLEKQEIGREKEEKKERKRRLAAREKREKEKRRLVAHKKREKVERRKAKCFTRNSASRVGTFLLKKSTQKKVGVAIPPNP